MKQPLAPVALLYALGILAGHWLDLPLLPLFAVCFAVSLTAIGWETARTALLPLLLVLLGWVNLESRTSVISPNDLRLLAGTSAQVATVRGVLRDSPAPRIFIQHDREFWHASVVIDVKEILLRDKWQNAEGKIIVYAPTLLPTNFFRGQSVEVAGVLERPPIPRAEGLFDARRFYAWQGIYDELRTDSSKDWSVLLSDSPAGYPLSDRFREWARNALATGLGPEDIPLRLIWTLALDWKAPLTASVEEPFVRAGTFHIFAVDGLRIGLLTTIVLGILRAARVPRSYCGLLIIPLLWSYTALTGWPASAVRAAIMMTIVIGGWAGRRPADLLNSLFAAAFVILLWDPNQLFQAGFQLSFLVVFCIALLVPPIGNQFQAWIFRSDPYLPKALKPRWPAPLHIAAIFIIDTCAVSIAAWLGSIPLAAAYFHVFTPVSIIANVVVVPLTALALMGTIASLLTAAFWPAVSVLFNHASWFLMACIVRFSNAAAGWPHGAWNVPSPSPETFLLYYLILFGLLTGWIFRTKHRTAFLFGLSGLCVIWIAQVMSERKFTHVHVLPLQGGTAIYVDEPGRNILFDCGSARTADSTVKPFLQAHGVNRLDALVLTAGHVQDAGGVPVILTNFSVGAVFFNPARSRSSAYREAVEFAQQHASTHELTNESALPGWRILHPDRTTHFEDADDNAVVAQRGIDDRSCVLLSSLGRRGQEALLASHPELRADVVTAGLPAQGEPLCESLLGQLHPQLVLVSDSESPATRRASSKLRSRLAADSAPVIFCSDCGAVKISLWKNGLAVENSVGESIRAP